MRKRFFTKSILLQGLIGGILFFLLALPAMELLASRPMVAIILLIGAAALQATLGMIIEAKFGENQSSQERNNP